ncbi:autotransporter outer membrane beta-barrel domain-containing protein [Pseudomonas sp. G.S.17]|uniref:autotransporter family protein n=1 Tax=Pseudomonas sp. G.S.17 TaxID=3137451 RepID=UPI00311CCE98
MNHPRGKSCPWRLAVLPVAIFGMWCNPARAACDLTTTLAQPVQTCDSGSSGALTKPSGNNTLIFPAGGTGAVTGNVTFGPGNDHVQMDSGKITGNVIQGDGLDSFAMTAGAISLDVSQGSGRDDFVMSGGTLRSLAQGDGLDTFLMTGGTISNAFEDGDSAKMTGGTIGRVDMKLDDNLFDMSGGAIIGNLVTGFGKDTIIISGGTVGGNVSVSGGDDSVSISGGEVRGEIRASFGNDTFNWRDGGLIRGAVLMADGNDTATLTHLTETFLGSNPLLDGGAGTDTLTFDASTTAVPGRYANWETVNLNNGSRMDLAGEMVLGDATSGTGMFNIDGTSTVTSAAGTLRPFTAGQLATLNNAGTLDMTTGSSQATDTLTVRGNYIGNSGKLLLQSVLGDDSSASDKLVVAQGAISGTTQINVTNLGGLGAVTQQNGIQLVQASEGATSTNSAFALSNSLSVGAYEYYLFKGGATAGSENSWFLRSTVLSPPIAVATTPVPPVEPTVPTTPVTPTEPTTPPTTPVTPTEPTTPPTTPVTPTEPTTPPTTPVTPTTPTTPTTPVPVQPAATVPVAAIGTPPLPAPVRGAAPITLYRMEVPNYAVATPAAAMLTQMSLGTFHDRQGEQSLLSESGFVPAGWARAFGNDFKRSWSGTVDPSLDASLKGYQVGHDLYASETASGGSQRTGFFVGHSRLEGHVDGFAGGFRDNRTGKLKIEGDSVGVYWTLVDPKGWYVDAVAMGTRLDGYARSDRAVRIDTKGRALSFSLEAGYPIPVSTHWVVEPQVQVINQHINLDSQNDGISHISFDSQAYSTGRVGARLKGRYMVSGMPVEPYVRSNLWHTFGGSDTVTFDHVDRIKTQHKSTTADVGIGLVAKVSKEVSLYVSADYSGNVDDDNLEGLMGNLGVRISW